MRTEAEIQEKLRRLKILDDGLHPVVHLQVELLEWTLGREVITYLPFPQEDEKRIASDLAIMARAAWDSAKNEGSMQEAANKWAELILDAVYDKLRH